MPFDRVQQVGVVASSFIFHVIVMGLSLSFGILYSELHAEFNVTQSRAVWVASLFTGLIGIAGVPVSWCVTRFGERKVAIVGSLLVSCGMFTSVFARSFNWFYLTYGLTGGLGACLCILPSTTIVMKTFSRNRPLALAISSSGSAIGNLSLPPLLTYMLSEYGWRGTFLLLAGLALQCLPAGFLFISDAKRFKNDSPAGRSSNKEKQSFKTTTCAIMLNHKFRMFALSAVPCFLVIFAPSTFLPDMMKEVKCTDQQIYIAMMMIGIGHLIGGLSPGILERIFRLDLMNIYTSVLLLGAASSVPFIFVRSFETFLGLAVLLGSVAGAFLSVHDALVSHFLDKEHNEIGFGWLCTVEGIAVVVGMPITGLVIDNTNTLRSGFLFTGAILLLSMILSLIVRRVTVGAGNQNNTDMIQVPTPTCKEETQSISCTDISLIEQNNNAFVDDDACI